MFRRILGKGLNESCHDPWSEVCGVLGFMRKRGGGGVVEAWGEVLQAGREARRAGQVFMYYVG